MAHIAALKAAPMIVSTLQALGASTSVPCMQNGQKPTSVVYQHELRMEPACFWGIYTEVGFARGTSV
jgi:hypothetical protein